MFSMLLLIFMMSSCDSCKEDDEVSPDDGKCTQNHSNNSLYMNYWFGEKPAANPMLNVYVDFATGKTFEKENSTCDAYLTGDKSGLTLVGMNGTKFKRFGTGDKFKDMCDQQLSGDMTDSEVGLYSSGTGSAVYIFKDQDGKYGAFWADVMRYFQFDHWWRIEVKIKYLDK